MSLTSDSIVAFDILCFLGTVLLTAAFCTACCSSKVPRASIWFTFVASLILTTIFNLLILGQQAGKPPNYTRCAVQAISIYSMPVLIAHTAAALLLQVYLSIVFIRKSRKLSNLHILLLNIVPVLTPIVIVIYSITIGLQNPSLIQRDLSGMRCHVNVDHDQLFDYSFGTSVTGVVVLLVLEVFVVSNLFRYRSTYEKLLTDNRMSPQVMIRVCFFNIFFILAVIVSLVPVRNRVNIKVLSNLTAALIPAVAGIMFFTQKDILTVWMFWRSPALSSVPSSV
ncbi:hypothetical protein GALMADRAFT_240690 [Galerina marginata CBS 339.88]|uniref:G-protein coupled receptors family 1 profile domain-containing protein n=1 Tax=Galerina marginata (strain CBS 339.88) TaxID=685588 RepID=A0A067TIH8_GALM3|nr:hypothetical protein GALMADRAFT_240690 [Galerina marginata CBS 339.88]